MGNPKALVENPACAGQQLIPGPFCTGDAQTLLGWTWDQ